MIERVFFHPVALCRDLHEQPVPVRLLGEDLVLWRDAAGQARVFTDRCPHRGAALSMGRVVDGALECPYHGWRFEPEGRCIAIPAVPEFTPPEGHRACAHQVREAYGLVWVCLSPADAATQAQVPAPLPAFAAEDDTNLRKVTSGPYDVQASAPRIVENFLDMSHFGFIHTGWLGTRDHTAMQPYKVEKTPTGIFVSDCFAWQPQSSVHAQGGAMVEYTYEVAGPYHCVLTKVPEATAVKLANFRESIALFVCPVEPERSRVWIRMAMNHSEDPDQKLIDFQNTIFGQDQPVLESQRPKLLPISDQAPVKEVHSAADLASSHYRRYLRELGVRFGTC
jgi:phenylpropionate dioxygenase-like ring-hydroxylating dioxygenase large terminal subunit